MYNIGYLGHIEGNMTNTKFSLYDYQVDPTTLSYLPDKLNQERKNIVKFYWLIEKLDFL